MPAVAFIPLVMLWVGIDEGSKMSINFIGKIFQMLLFASPHQTQGEPWPARPACERYQRLIREPA